MSEAPAPERPVARAPAGWARAETVSDEALLAAAAGGDGTAAAALVGRHQRRVFGIAYAVTNDRDTAEDVAQETFLRVWRHAAVFDAHRSSAVTWISTITRNLAIDVVRARQRSPLDRHEGLSEIDGPDTGPSVEERTLGADLAGRIRAAIGTLPPGQRRALMRAAFYGQTAAEISAAERIPLGTAKGRIRLGLQKVRDALGSQTGALDGPRA